jgi:hypothetical protein
VLLDALAPLDAPTRIALRQDAAAVAGFLADAR